jgi:nucleotide-binding universal stress UspA family protein
MGSAMAYKDILVAVDGGTPARGRIELAAALAERFAAHIVGLYLSIVGEEPQQQSDDDAPLLDPLYREFGQKMPGERAAAQALFEEVAGRRGLSREWRAAAGYPSQAAALHGRYVDLIVLGQLDPEGTPAPLTRPLPEEVALAAGRPVLVVPYAGAFAEIGRNVLVAWDSGRAATRAVADAMPLLVGARSVTVLSVNPQEGPSAHGAVPGADIGLHLARHGVNATIEATAAEDIDIGNALLSRAADLDADLLVMGAYGHSRVRELVLGGITRTIIDSMTLPVLMAH